MAETTITLSRYRYVPKNLELQIDQEVYSYLNGGVTYINIIHDYIQKRMPVIQMGLELTVDYIARIYNNLEKSRIKFDLVEERLAANGDVLESRMYLQKVFSIVPAHERTTFITSDDPSSISGIDVMRRLQHFEMYLIDFDNVQWFEAKRDADFDKITYGALLKACFVMRDIPAQTVMATPPLQVGEIEKAVIPLGTLIQNIRHINSTYGIYDNNPYIYYDYRRFYCLSKLKPNVELEDAEDFGTILCVLRNPDNQEHLVQGSYDDPERRVHILNIQNEPSIHDDSIYDTNAKMSTVTSVNSTGSVDKTTIDEGSAKAQYIYAVNDLSESQYVNEAMNGLDIRFTVQSICLRMLAPHKDVRFNVDSSYRNLKLEDKVFRLAGWSVNIVREGMTEYTSQVNIILQEPVREGLIAPEVDEETMMAIIQGLAEPETPEEEPNPDAQYFT